MTTSKTTAKRARKSSKTVAENVATVENLASTALVAVETVESASERDARETSERQQAFVAYRSRLTAAFDARATYEREKDCDNDNIQATLKDLKASVSSDVVSVVFFAASVDANFINVSERRTARFNVYSAQKVCNIARAIATSLESLNHYSRAILLSAVALQNADLLLTHRDAAAACSLDVKTIAARDSMLVRYARHIASNTASTQSSSSINALRMFDILQETRDANNESAYRVNLDSQITQALLARLV